MVNWTMIATGFLENEKAKAEAMRASLAKQQEASAELYTYFEKKKIDQMFKAPEKPEYFDSVETMTMSDAFGMGYITK